MEERASKIRHRPGIRLRIKPPKRRSALNRLKARIYYRKNRTKIRIQRRRYLRRNKSTLKHRKLFKRFKPTWFKKPPKHHKLVPHKVVPHKTPKFKISVPKKHR